MQQEFSPSFSPGGHRGRKLEREKQEAVLRMCLILCYRRERERESVCVSVCVCETADEVLDDGVKMFK